jgi:hypothetical protein
MTENVAPQFEDFRARMRQFFRAVMEIAIENDVYFSTLIERCSINPDSLRQIVKEAQESPEKQEEMRQRFAEMWNAIEGAGTAAFVEEELDKLPLPDKPN